MKKKGRLQNLNLLLCLSFILMMASLCLIFIYAPDVKGTGVEQRIFYFHVPIAIASYLAFLIIFISSILFIRNRDMKWDRLARSSAEIGLIFTTLVLITGPIWAKPAWETWWNWEPRLTTSLILWFIYIAYLMVHSLAMEENRGALFAAVVGIVGFIDVPINYLTIHLWKSTETSVEHPALTSIDASILFILIVCMLAVILLFIVLLIYRVSLGQMETEIEDARIILEEKER